MNWFRAALGVNILLFLIGLSMLPFQGLGPSLWHVASALALFTVLFAAHIYHKRRVYRVHFFAVLLFLANVWAVSNIDSYAWIDIPLHFLGGFFVALYILACVDLSPKLSFFLTISMVVLIGVVWEWAEFLASLYVVHAGFVIIGEDILLDLLMDFLGGLFVAGHNLFIRSRLK